MLQVHPRPAFKDITSRSFVPIYRLPIHAFSTALCGASASVYFVLIDFVSCAVRGVAKREKCFLFFLTLAFHKILNFI